MIALHSVPHHTVNGYDGQPELLLTSMPTINEKKKVASQGRTSTAANINTSTSQFDFSRLFKVKDYNLTFNYITTSTTVDFIGCIKFLWIVSGAWNDKLHQVLLRAHVQSPKWMSSYSVNQIQSFMQIFDNAAVCIISWRFYDTYHSRLTLRNCRTTLKLIISITAMMMTHASAALGM